MRHQEIINYIITLIDEYKTSSITKECFCEKFHALVSDNELEYSEDENLEYVLEHLLPDACLFYVDEPGEWREKENGFCQAMLECEELLKKINYVDYSKRTLEYENEIVFSECDDILCDRLFDFFRNNKYNVVKKYQDANGDELFIVKRDNIDIQIWKCYQSNAIFICFQELDFLLDDYLKRCPKCNSSNTIESIPYSCATEEDFISIEKGELALLPAAYDRIGVPIPNWMCKDCKFKWHNRKDLEIRNKEQF